MIRIERFFESPLRVLHLSTFMMMIGVLILSTGIALAYGNFVQLTMGELIGAHVLIVLGPTLFKLGYVLRLVAQQRIHRELSPN